VKACFVEVIVNDYVDGVYLDTLHVFGLWQAKLKEVEGSIDEEAGDANV
jgi:hypothetical protein